MAPKTEKLSKKEKDFAKEFVKTGNGTRSALKVYDTKSKNTAANIASENLKKPKIVKFVKSIADKIPDKLLVEKHLELLNKKEVIARNNIKSGEVDVIPTGEIDANAVGKGLEMAYKLKGSFAAEKFEDVTPGVGAVDDSRNALIVFANVKIKARRNLR